MHFDTDRLAKLAGISGRGSGLMTEAGNRSKHDESGALYQGYDYYEGDLNESDPNDEMYDLEEDLEESDADMSLDDIDEDIVLEINESELRNEILKMRSQTSLDETRLRKSIRGEIKSILKELQRSGGKSDSLWMYGGKSTSNSRRGYVNTAFPGVGFKKF